MPSTGLILAALFIVHSHASPLSSLEATITPMDILFDASLDQIKAEIIAQGYNDYQIPDFSTEIALPLWLKVTIEGRGGSFQDASTMARHGSAYILNNAAATNETVQAQAGLTTFNISFDYFRAKFLFFEIGGGPFEFTTDSNVISFSVTVYTPTNTTCTTYVNWARIEDFTGQKLSLPWGMLNTPIQWYVNSWLNWSFIKDIVIDILNPKFFLAAEYAVQLADICG